MSKWVRIFKRLSYLACAGTAVISLLTLAGFVWDISRLRQWFGDGASMRFNTAIGLLFAALSMPLLTIEPAASLRWHLRILGKILALVPLSIGILTLLHYGLEITSGFDELFFHDPLPPLEFPGRPSPETSLDLLLIGVALLIMNRPEPWARKAVRAMSFVFLALPMISLMGTFFGANNLYSLFESAYHVTGAATNTCIATVLLAFALFFRQPNQGIASLFVSDTMGGLMARRQLLALTVLPFVVVFLSHLDIFFIQPSKALSQAISILLALSALLFLNWLTARQLDRMDRQKQANERQLRDKERLLSGVLDAVPVGIWITDGTGHIVRGNPAGKNVWRGERYVGIEEYGQYKGWWISNGELIGSHEWALARALEKGETSVDETIEIECFDGSRKVILNSAMPLRNEQGEIVGAIVTNYDISRRYRLERNQALVAHAGEELIAMRDVEGTFAQVAKLTTKTLCDCSLIHALDDDGAVKMVSRSMRETPRAQRFNTLVDRYPPNPHSAVGIHGVIEKGRSILVSDVDEKIISSIAQDEFHFNELREVLHSYMLVPMVVERKIIGTISFIGCDPAHRFDDVDLAAAEELGRLSALAIENARYAEKLRQAIQTREDVVAIVSHDLRSPLSVILHSCDLMLNKLDGSPESLARVRKLASLAKTAGKRMNELISDLLDLAHLESGQFALKIESLDGGILIGEMVDIMNPIAAQKGVLLHADLPEDLPWVNADRTRFAQILNNLMSNAIKHTASGGSVEVRAHLREDGWLEVAVIDTGSGIKKENLPLLFERYWKPQESKSGFGLGLFVVKGIVEAHGGHIKVTSEENKGTCFCFTLPTVSITASKKLVPVATVASYSS